MGPNPNDRSKLGHGLVNRLTNSLCLADQFGQSAQIVGDSPQNQPLTKHLIPNFSSKAIFLIPLEKKFGRLAWHMARHCIGKRL
jgi:hypothetical protein